MGKTNKEKYIGSMKYCLQTVKKKKRERERASPGICSRPREKLSYTEAGNQDVWSKFPPQKTNVYVTNQRTERKAR